MISPETIEKVKDISIVDLISETVSLKRAGNNFTGLCPFHNEKSPSFHVKAEQDFFHCFGCGESGNAISFAMKTQNLSFPEAIEYLANKFNIPIVYTNTTTSQAGNSKNDLYKINALAYEFFQEQLKNSPAVVRNYIDKRQLLPEAIKKFTVGYAPAEWGMLHQFLLSRKVDPKILMESALVKRNSSGKYYDTFRDRLIFPIWVDNSRIAGFGGRIITEDPNNPQAKYLNSPETKVYQKSQIFYGLPQALNAIKTEKKVYIVEGYLDVIALHQVNVCNVIATCGTALTEQHVKKLGGLATQVQLLFDGDSAGQAAAAKCFPQMINFEADIAVLFLPDQQDPDDFAKLHKNNTFTELGKLTSKSLMECYLDDQVKKQGYEGRSALGAVIKSKLAEQVNKIIGQNTNPIVRTELQKQLQFLLNLKLTDLTSHPISPEIIFQEELNDSQTSNVIPKIEDLDYLNRDILKFAIIKKGEACRLILNNSSLAQHLDSNVSNFIASVLEIDQDQSSDLNQRKNELKSLLDLYPISWTEFWKLGSKQAADTTFNAEQLYKQILQEVKKRPWKQQISLLETQIKNAHSEDDKTKLATELIEANKILRKL